MTSQESSPGPLETALDEAVKAAEWLSPSDMAAVALASTYARRIDKGTVEFADGEIDSPTYNKVLYLGPHLMNTLKAIGLAPEERIKILAAVGPVKEADPVDELKNRRRKRVAG